MSAVSTEMKKRHSQTVSELRSKLKLPKRCFNQAIQRKMNIINRKNIVISSLRKKLEGSSLATELEEIRLELQKLKETHKKLLKNRKGKRASSSAVSTSKYVLMQEKLKMKDVTIREYEHEKLVLQDMIYDYASERKDPDPKSDGKTYSTSIRMMVFDNIINHVRTKNIPILMSRTQIRAGKKPSDVPQRTTVELMARELGVIAELQAAETIIDNENVTMGFDATTQEGTHVNSIHFTTKTDCVAAAVDELPGGTAADYANHVTQTVDRLSETFAYFHDEDYQTSRQKIIGNITNTMTDRCAANAAALRLVKEVWQKTLNELNCHLHPLDTIASSSRSALKKLESTQGKVFSKDCIAANVVLQVNKLRFKDGKGDPRGFTAFLDKKNLPRTLLPRYRGNRLHVLFKICGLFIEHYDVLEELFSSGTSCGTLRSRILEDFRSDTAKLEFLVLGFVGKLLTGPWMKKFYISAEEQMNHVDGIAVVKVVIQQLKSDVDVFGEKMPDDNTLKKLRLFPVSDKDQLAAMLKAVLAAVVDVLERQYSRYFSLDINDKLSP